MLYIGIGLVTLIVISGISVAVTGHVDFRRKIAEIQTERTKLIDSLC